MWWRFERGAGSVNFARGFAADEDSLQPGTSAQRREEAPRQAILPHPKRQLAKRWDAMRDEGTPL